MGKLSETPIGKLALIELEAHPSTPPTAGNAFLYRLDNGKTYVMGSDGEYAEVGAGGGGGLIYRFTSAGFLGPKIGADSSGDSQAFDIATFLNEDLDASHKQRGSRRIPVDDRNLDTVFRFRAKGRFNLSDAEGYEVGNIGFHLSFITDPDGTPGRYGYNMGFYMPGIELFEVGATHNWTADLTMQVGQLQGSPESDDWGYFWQGEMMIAESDGGTPPFKVSIASATFNQGPIDNDIPVIEFEPQGFINGPEHEDNWMSLEFLTIEKLTVTGLV